MANVIITADANHDDLTTRNAGQNITINGSAVLTIDSYVQETAMGLLGQIVTNDGTWKIDGTQVKEFAYSSGSGTLPTVGDIITDSGGASGKVIYLNSGTAANGIITVTQQSGTFAASNTLSSGTFSATLSSVKVGYLQVFLEDGNNSGKGLGTLDFEGEWYEIGVGDGTDNQTFDLPHEGSQQGVWIETGAGTDVYERWIRKDSNRAFTDYQTGELGNVYNQGLNDPSVTFGTSTNGGTPPNGAKLRIPNVHCGTATLALPTTELAVDQSGNNMWNIGTNSSLSVKLNRVNFSTVNTQFTGFDSLTITDSCVSMTNASLGTGTVNETTITNSVILGSGDYAGSEGSNITLTDVNGVTITDSFFGAFKDFPVAFNTSSNITLNNVVFNGMDPTHANNNRRIRFSNCATVRGTNVKGIRVELVFEVGTKDVIFNNYRFSDGENATLLTANAQSTLFFQTGASDILFDGVALIPNGAPHRNDFAEFTDAINCIIRNVGTINSKIDFQNHTDFLANFAGVSNGCKLQRVYVNNTRNARATNYTPTTINCEVTNCSSGYDRGQVPDSKDTFIQGMHGCNGNFNTNQGIEIDFPLTAGVHGVDFFTSDTTGRIHALFTPPTTETQQYVTLTGDAIFNREGDLLLRNTGDSAEIEIPYLILGHDALTNVNPSVNGNFVQVTEISYAIDTGSGYSAFKTATGANLSAETISPSGFRIKFKFESPSNNANRLVNGFFIETTTSLTSQSNNFYPFARPLWGYNLTQTGSKVVIFDDTTDAIVGTGTEDGTGLTVAEVPWENNFDAVQRLRLPGFESIGQIATITENGGVSAGVQSAYSLIPSTDPNLTSNITITNHAGSPVSWDAGNGAKDYSITVQTDATGDNFTDVQLLNEINYSVSQTDAYFGFNGFAWPEMVIQAGTAVETARGRLFGSAGAQLKGVRVIQSDGSSAHPAILRFQSDDGTYGQAPVTATVSITGITAGSRLRIFNETTSTEIHNDIVNSTTYTNNYTDGTDFSSGDVVNVRITYQSGTAAKLGFSSTAVASSSGFSILADQKDDEIYNTIGIDGFGVTKFDADYVNDEVDIVSAVDFSGHELYARFAYFITTEDGIRSFFGAFTAIDIANFENDVTVLDLYINNNTSTNLIQTDNVRLFKSNGVYPIRNPTTGGGGVDVVWRDKIFVAETGTSGLTPAEAANLSSILTNTNRVDGLIEDDNGDQFTDKALSQAPSGGGGGGATAADIYTYFTDGTREDAFKADVSGLSTFDPSSDTVTTDTASRDASKADVSGLSTFDPTVDEVITDTASRDASKADTTSLATKANQEAINDNVKDASLLIPASENLPD